MLPPPVGLFKVKDIQILFYTICVQGRTFYVDEFMKYASANACEWISFKPGVILHRTNCTAR